MLSKVLLREIEKGTSLFSPRLTSAIKAEQSGPASDTFKSSPKLRTGVSSSSCMPNKLSEEPLKQPRRSAGGEREAACNKGEQVKRSDKLQASVGPATGKRLVAKSNKLH